jgi:hypothetical protein
MNTGVVHERVVVVALIANGTERLVRLEDGERLPI